jgi:hypothetical protein
MPELRHSRDVLDRREVARDHHSALPDVDGQTFVTSELDQEATRPK